MDEHSPDLAIEHWPLARLEPYARNARTHSDEQVARLAASIVEFGWTVPVLIDADGAVIAGHGRLLAAEQLGLDSAPVIRLEHLSPAQARAYRIADNRLTELGGWNDELLSNELHQLNGEGFDLALTGFDGAELDRLMEPLDHAPGRAGEDDDTDDDAPVPPREAIARPGDLWLLGDHRLLCGDSTDGDTVTRVMDRERAALLFTSPPYGEQRDYTTGGIGDWDALMRGVFAAPPMTHDGQILVNLGLIHRDGEWQPYWENWIVWMREQGWRRFGLYVWDQGPGLAGDWHGRLAPSFELIFHFNRETRRPNKTVPCVSAGHIHREGKGDLRDKDGTSGTWTHAGRPVQEMRIPDSVIRIGRHRAAGGPEAAHPAVFPVKLPAFAMEAYSGAGDVVYDPYCGSGTTIVAGERTGRRVRAVELASEYVDVAIRRWRQLFPDRPLALEDGRAFEAVAKERGKELSHAA